MFFEQLTSLKSVGQRVFIARNWSYSTRKLLTICNLFKLVWSSKYLRYINSNEIKQNSFQKVILIIKWVIEKFLKQILRVSSQSDCNRMVRCLLIQVSPTQMRRNKHKPFCFNHSVSLFSMSLLTRTPIPGTARKYVTYLSYDSPVKTFYLVRHQNYKYQQIGSAFYVDRDLSM